MSIVAVDTITDAAGGNTASINGIPLRQGVIDPENRIINGAFDFWQRGTSSTAGGYATADRWAASISGGTVTTSRQDYPAGFTIGSNNPRYYLRQTVSGQTGSNFAYVLHRIEGVRNYAGQTITVLGWARRASGAGDMRVAAAQNFGTGGSPSSLVGLGDQTVTLSPTAFEPFAVVMTLPSITGKTLGTNNNDYLEILFGLSNGGSFGLQTIGVDLWGIHIKLGIHTADATALYKQPELGPELARCQRYYETGKAFGQGAISYNDIGYSFAVRKRVAPTIAIINVSGSGYANLTQQTTTADTVNFNYQATTGGGYVFFDYAADAEL